MQLADAQALALRLMREFKLISDDQHMYENNWRNWRFEFDDAVRRFGCCHRSRRLITLSRTITILNEQPEVEDTIRHEIAHALCLPREGHGPAWKTMCAHTGAKPQRCYSHDNVEAPKGEWRATCPVCKHVFHYHRKPKSDRWCVRPECKRMSVPYIHGHAGHHPARKLVFRHINEIVIPVDEKKRRAALDAMKALLKAN